MSEQPESSLEPENQSDDQPSLKASEKRSTSTDHRPARPEASLPARGRTSGCILPNEKVFSVQVGSEVFRLSGASIASDGL